MLSSRRTMRRNTPFRALRFFVSGLALFATSDALAVETLAKQAILVDLGTGMVLMEKNADEPMPPSSMSKLMTVYAVFERLQGKKISLDDTFLVSEKAWRKGGSKMFIKVNTRVRIEDLLRGIIVQSGNDACIVIAEGISGNEEAFAEMITRRARELGLEKSVFKNATGWPEEGHIMTAREIARLSILTIRNFPDYYQYYREKSFSYNGIRQGNRNPLLYRSHGADGLKTGHTEAAGFGLAASTERKGRRLVLVVNGLPSRRARSSESARLMEWGFRAFENYQLFKAGETVTAANVWLGAEETVPLAIENDLVITLARKARLGMKVKAIYEDPIPAPIETGVELGKLVISAPGTETIEVPLRAAAGVARLGFFGRLGSAIRHILWGSSG